MAPITAPDPVITATMAVLIMVLPIMDMRQDFILAVGAVVGAAITVGVGAAASMAVVDSMAAAASMVGADFTASSKIDEENGPA